MLGIRITGMDTLARRSASARRHGHDLGQSSWSFLSFLSEVKTELKIIKTIGFNSL